MNARRAATAALLLGPALFVLLLFKHLAYPVLWNDEGETVMYGVRVLEYGYPKVHGPRNTVYLSPLPERIAILPDSDAYVGTGWGHFYLAAVGVALAEGHDDPYPRTARLRAPFAAAGWLGLLALAALVVGAAPPGAGSTRLALGCAGLFFWLACLDVSLLLQLREARHPPLVVLLSSAAVVGWWRRGRSERGRPAWGALTAASLVGIHLTFFPAFVAMLLGFVASALTAPGDRSPRRRAASAAWALAPVGLAVLVAAATVPFFHTVAVAAAHLEVAPRGAASFAENLGRTIAFLALHGHLTLVLATRAALFATRERAPGRVDPGERAPRELALLLIWLAAVFAAVLSATPSLFGRYLTPVAPWLCAIAALDTLRLALRWRAASGNGRRLVTRAVAAVAGALLLGASWHVPSLAGRWHEIWTPYRGPLDHAIGFLRETYGSTRELLILTNYEDAVLMYYLDARVRRAGPRADVPDVVIPRRAHRPDRLAPTLRRHAYRVQALPVADWPFNNIPELFPWKPLRDHRLPTHRFRAPAPGPDHPALRIFWRSRSPQPDSR